MITVSKPVNSCPSCGSLYLLPDNFRLKKRFLKNPSITLSERFVSLIVGFFAGLFTFFIWGIASLIIGGAQAGKVPFVLIYIGIKWSVYVGIAVSVFGFLFGEKRLIKLIGIIWGTDVDEYLDKLRIEVPLWFVYLMLLIVIVGVYGYLFSGQ